jgi:hypothetical protein
MPNPRQTLPGAQATARLTLSHRTPEALERLQEKGLDIVGLKAPGLRTLHFLANAENAAGVHGIMGESVLFQEILLALRG